MLRGHGIWKFAVILVGSALAYAAVSHADDSKAGRGSEKKGERAGRPEGPPSAAKIFEMIDADKDGSISKKEFEAAHKKRMEMMRKHRASGAHGRAGHPGPPHHGHAGHHGPPRRGGEHGRAGGPPHHRGHHGGHHAHHRGHGKRGHGHAGRGPSAGKRGECPHCKRGKGNEGSTAHGKGHGHRHGEGHRRGEGHKPGERGGKKPEKSAETTTEADAPAEVTEAKEDTELTASSEA